MVEASEVNWSGIGRDEVAFSIELGACSSFDLGILLVAFASSGGSDVEFDSAIAMVSKFLKSSACYGVCSSALGE